MANLNARSGEDLWARNGATLKVGAAPLTPLTDAAVFNADFAWETDLGLPTRITDLNGDTIRANKVLPQGANVPGTVRWQLDAGIEVDSAQSGVITFAFADSSHSTGQYNNPNNGFPEGIGYSPFSAAQRDAARIAIENWDDLISAEFQEVNGTGGADIVLANTSTGPAQAWAYYPVPGGSGGRQFGHLGSDVWIADPDFNASNNQLDPGFYGLQTLNHELGHTLGLSHPGTYDFGDDLDGDGEPDPITYTGDAQYFQDSHQFTIMSYFDSFETGAQNVDWNVMRFVYPSTPMVDDVFVIQQKYGADMTTRTGNTTYGFNATADVTNEAMRFEDGEMFTIFTIWDAGGNDTLDLSGYYSDSVIDLREGAYSSAGGWGAYDPALLGVDPTLAQINANNADAGLGARNARLFEIYFNGGWSDDGGATLVNEGLSWLEITGSGEDLLMEQNIGIAYGAIVENAVGGHGDDVIVGNQANNRLTGGAGADRFVFAEDNSLDTITDFQTRVDKIDLSELDVARRDVRFNAANDTLYINTDNDSAYEMSIIVHGNDVDIARDILF